MANENEPRNSNVNTNYSAMEDLKKNLSMLEKFVQQNQHEKIVRVFRQTTQLRLHITCSQLNEAVRTVLSSPESKETIKNALLSYLAVVMPIEANAAVKSQEVKQTTTEENETQVKTKKAITLTASTFVEVEIYLGLLVLMKLLKFQQFPATQECAYLIIQRCEQLNKRTLDHFLAKAYGYFSYAHELTGNLPAIRPMLMKAHRTACLRYDEIGQATLLNLLLRSFLHENLYEQAFKLISKTIFPESVSNNQFVRYLYYVGRIQAVQLEYTESYTRLNQSIRKAPQNTAVGFRRTVHKLAIIVQLLMGEIPERNIFNQPELKLSLLPYLELTNAVRVGNLQEFNQVLNKYSALFKTDKTYTLILRLRHNVIKTGLRKINVSYSKILFKDICEKLALDTPQNAEFVCAKAIRDGVIDAVIDHKNGWLQSKENLDVYTTTEPQQAFHKRITFCLDVHNEAVKAMRYPPDAYKKDLESAEERLEREKQEEELAKEIEDELDEGL